MINFDVGGKSFTTQKSTLQKYKDTFFSGLLSGNFPLNEKNIFIDRDPKHFRVILNFLRYQNPNIQEFPLSDDFYVLEEIEKEADFYNIVPLIELIQKKKNDLSENLDEKESQYKKIIERLDSIETQAKKILQAIDETYCGFSNGSFLVKKK
ncbi:potassium channel tetramerization domain-containing [Anaeramoeba ignava]|uniref:Potassium channel tetramerization domain-containing n=1 Tax=Anaeramoeba ignava TaxID=1746090 RepID=A0A9Q0R4X3_ANAIG|nr:potassium channel tetramerization domain-containing [Anaeramoeba ignava]